MITVVAGPAENKRTCEVSATMTQGRWGFRNDVNSDGDEIVTPVSSYTHAQ